MPNDLMIIDENKAVEIFGTDENKIDPIIEKIEKEVRSFHLDISTPSGRQAIKSLAHKVARTKTALDGMGKGLTEEVRKKIKSIDAERRRMRERLDALKEEVRKPLTEYEDKEKTRIAAHEAWLEEMIGLVDFVETPASNDIKERSIKLRDIIYQHDWEEFAQRAEEEFNQIDRRLSQMLEDREKQEAEAAELEQLRKENAEREQKERDERIAREAAEKAKLEAEEKARQEREAAEAKVKAEKEEAERKAQAERDKLERKAREERKQAERYRIESEERAKAAEKEAEKAAQKERQRIEDEKQAEIEAAAREANKKHCAKINREALKALTAEGLSEADGKTVIEAIAKHKIPNVAITY